MSTCNDRPPVPSGAIAPTTNALLEFDGYYWWTNYPFGISNSGYWLNGQQWDPRMASVDSEGLHLNMKQTQLPNGPRQWSSIELVLWGEVTNNPNSPTQIPTRSYPGFGKYLVAAKTPNGTFNDISNNCCFGVFTYQFDANNTHTNSHRELDMLECSRWGNTSDPTNAQFTLQPWSFDPNNVHRITLDSTKDEITIVMDWLQPGSPVTYSIYYGAFDLSSLPASPDITWTTASGQNQFIPNEGCQTVHFNLWRQPPNTVTPSGDQEVIITKFQFDPASERFK